MKRAKRNKNKTAWIKKTNKQETKTKPPDVMFASIAQCLNTMWCIIKACGPHININLWNSVKMMASVLVLFFVIFATIVILLFPILYGY